MVQQRGNRGLICQATCLVLFYLVISRSCFTVLCPCDESPGFCQHFVFLYSRQNRLRTWTLIFAMFEGYGHLNIRHQDLVVAESTPIATSALRNWFWAICSKWTPAKMKMTQRNGVKAGT